jgi:hypothetical protein
LDFQELLEEEGDFEMNNFGQVDSGMGKEKSATERALELSAGAPLTI